MVGESAERRTSTSLRSDHDWPPVLEFGLAHGPRTARCTAAQGLDRELQLVPWLQGLARPSVAHQRAWGAAFEAPKLGTAVLLLGFYDDESVRAGELELLHHPLELDRIFLIEHRARVVRQGRAAGGDEGAHRTRGKWRAN